MLLFTKQITTFNKNEINYGASLIGRSRLGWKLRNEHFVILILVCRSFHGGRFVHRAVRARRARAAAAARAPRTHRRRRRGRTAAHVRVNTTAQCTRRPSTCQLYTTRTQRGTPAIYSDGHWAGAPTLS